MLIICQILSRICWCMSCILFSKNSKRKFTFVSKEIKPSTSVRGSILLQSDLVKLKCCSSASSYFWNSSIVLLTSSVVIFFYPYGLLAFISRSDNSPSSLLAFLGKTTTEESICPVYAITINPWGLIGIWLSGFTFWYFFGDSFCFSDEFSDFYRFPNKEIVSFVNASNDFITSSSFFFKNSLCNLIYSPCVIIFLRNCGADVKVFGI